MSAGKEKSVNIYPEKLGIIAGAGNIPAQLVLFCKENNIEPFVVGLKDITDGVEPDFWSPITHGGKIVTYLKIKNIKHVVMIGAVKKEKLLETWTDWETFCFFVKVMFKTIGDSSLLSAARKEIERRGFTLMGIHEFLPDLLMEEGALTKFLPASIYDEDIEMGFIAARKHGEVDKGQAVIVKRGNIIAKEGRSGTSAMIKGHGQAGAVLVKACKPQQDKNLDLPTIGPETVRLCAAKKMAGIVGHAGETLVVDKEQTIALAEKHNIFIFGFNHS